MKKPVSASVHQFFRPASAASRPASAAPRPASDQSADEPDFGEEVSENDADEKDSEDGTDLGSSRHTPNTASSKIIQKRKLWGDNK
jgi:hypothetical protein